MVWAENGFADCYYRKNTSSPSDRILFSETGENFHKQPYWRPSGTYNYTIECFDSANNMVITQTVFDVETDNQPPTVVRAFYDSGDIKLVTDELAQCSYSTEDCLFTFDDEEITPITLFDTTEHPVPWNPDTDLYVKCKDKYDNYPFDYCSIELRASDYFG